MSENNKKYILITAALIVIGAALYFFTGCVHRNIHLLRSTRLYNSMI